LAAADTLDSIVFKTDLTKRAGVVPDVSSVLALNATLAALSDVLRLLSIEKIGAVVNNSLIMLESGSPALRMTAGILFAEIAANIEVFRSPPMIQLRGQLLSLVPGAFDGKSPVHQLGLAAALGTAKVFDIPDNDVARTCAGVLKGLQYDKGELECRRKAFDFLAAIIDRVPKPDLEEDGLFEALWVVFDTVPFSAALLPPLQCYVEVATDLTRLVGPSRLSVAGLFAVLAVDEEKVLDLLEKIARGPIVEGLARLLGPGQLAQCGLIGLKAVKTPYSPRFLKVVCEIALAVDPVNDRHVNEFKRALLPVLIQAANPGVPEVHELAVRSIQVLVK
jgi:hypothetical protein